MTAHLELPGGAEFVEVVLGDLSDLEQSDLAVVVDDRSTLDVRLGLVRDLHDVLGLRVDHRLHDVQVDDSSQVVNVRDEDVLLAGGNELVEQARVSQGVEDVSVAWRVPVGLLALGRGGAWEERLLVDSRVSRLLEGEDVDVVVLVLLDDPRSVLVGVERVHEDERHVDVVLGVEVLVLVNARGMEILRMDCESVRSAMADATTLRLAHDPRGPPAHAEPLQPQIAPLSTPY